MRCCLLAGAFGILLLGACGVAGKTGNSAAASGPEASITAAGTPTTTILITTTVASTSTTLPACDDPKPAVDSAKAAASHDEEMEIARYQGAVAKKKLLASAAHGLDGVSSKELEAALTEGLSALAEEHNEKMAAIDSRLATRLQTILTEVDIERAARSCG
jgi:hypothetical protein